MNVLKFLGIYAAAFLSGFAYRVIVRKFAKRTVSSAGSHRNIGASDRLLRAGIGTALLLWAAATGWSPVTVFFSGICFFEAIFSWCAFYQAVGKNTCPV